MKPFVYSGVPAWLFGISYGAWYLFEGWLSLRDWGKRFNDHDRGTRWTLMIYLCVGLGLASLAAWIAPQLAIPLAPWPLLIAGLLLLWAGLALRAWSVITLGRFFRTKVTVQKGQPVVEDGPYAAIRHPSYAGALLILLGIGIALGNALSVLCALIIPFIAFRRRMLVEERTLDSLLGAEYRAYRRKTPRLVPGLW